jgi:serine/threonine protein kinase
MWSLGVLLYIVLCGSPPFNEHTLFEQISSAVFNFPDAQWKHISKEVKDLVRKLLTADPKFRVTASQALRHPWIRNQSGGGGADDDIQAMAPPSQALQLQSSKPAPSQESSTGASPQQPPALVLQEVQSQHPSTTTREFQELQSDKPSGTTRELSDPISQFSDTDEIDEFSESEETPPKLVMECKVAKKRPEPLGKRKARSGPVSVSQELKAKPVRSSVCMGVSIVLWLIWFGVFFVCQNPVRKRVLGSLGNHQADDAVGAGVGLAAREASKPPTSALTNDRAKKKSTSTNQLTLTSMFQLSNK